MLTDAAIRNPKPRVKPNGFATTKPYKLADSGGLYLEVHPAGVPLLAVEVPPRRQGEAPCARRLSDGELARRPATAG